MSLTVEELLELDRILGFGLSWVVSSEQETMAVSEKLPVTIDTRKKELRDQGASLVTGVSATLPRAVVLPAAVPGVSDVGSPKEADEHSSMCFEVMECRGIKGQCGRRGLSLTVQVSDTRGVWVSETVPYSHVGEMAYTVRNRLPFELWVWHEGDSVVTARVDPRRADARRIAVDPAGDGVAAVSIRGVAVLLDETMRTELAECLTQVDCIEHEPGAAE